MQNHFLFFEQNKSHYSKSAQSEIYLSEIALNVFSIMTALTGNPEK